MKRKVDVSLLGHRFTVRTEKDEAYVHSLASHVVRRIEEVRRQMRTASLQEQALLVALHLADELFEHHERAAATRTEVRRQTELMIGKLTAALADVHSDGRGDATTPIEATVAQPEDESAPVAAVAIARQH